MEKEMEIAYEEGRKAAKQMLAEDGVRALDITIKAHIDSLYRYVGSEDNLLGSNQKENLAKLKAFNDIKTENAYRRK
jgi:hypothetical protein